MKLATLKLHFSSTKLTKRIIDNMFFLSEIINLVGFWDAALALFGLFIFTCLLEKFTNKGPMLWPVVGIAPSLFLNISNIYDWATPALIRAGGTFRFRGMWFGGAHGIVTIDPSKIEYMLKTRFINFPKGQYYRERFRDLLGDGIFNADSEMWKEQRRIATSEMHSSRFSDHSFLSMQVLVHDKLLKLMEHVVSSKNGVVDLQEVLLRFTFDNICITALGIDPGCLAFDLPEIPFAKAFEEATELTLFRFMVPPFVWKVMKFFEMGYERRLKESIGIVHDFAGKVVTERWNELIKLSGLKDRSDLLSRLMEYTDQNPQGQGKQKRFSDKFLTDFCISFILAGRDTSSVALAWFFWLVQKNPKVENKILKEVNDILGGRECSQKNPIFTVEELKKMVYLQAALSESLRLYPAVPIDIKEVVEDDVFPDGTMVKKGGRVLYSIFSMARIESIWGRDCLEFKPERWIKDGAYVSENQFKYPVFNAGPRLCLGKKFAYMQMKMVAAAILLRYEVEVVEEHNVVPKLTTTLYMQNGLLVTLKPRFLTTL